MNNETEQIFLLNAVPSQSSAPTQRVVSLAPPPSSQVNLENVRDFSHVCRTCATITEFVMPIFTGEGLQNNLADKIKKHLPIQVCEADELPLVVCYQCASTLLAWHELVKCCMQADAALRAKLSSNKRKTNASSVTIKSNSAVEPATPSKYSSAYPRQFARPQQVAGYQEHLATAHADLLFYCEDCGSYVDRKNFIRHVSPHSAQCNTLDLLRNKFKKKKEESVSQNPSPVLPAPATKCSPKTESKPLTITDDKKPPMVVKTKTTVQENEFSDHSDTDGFGPLPESVFEAIEDSQDSQHLEDTSHTAENERLSDESNKSSQPENNSLTTDPAVCLKSFNNCSVVIEPIKINDCAQMNLAIKNSDINILNNNLALTAKKNAPKTTLNSDSHTNGDRKQRKKIRHCPLCPKQYSASSSYYYHLTNSHKGSKERACEVCGKKFGTIASLAQHMVTHSAQYEFQCKQCQKQFKSKASLYIHEQTHNGKKSWSCSQCRTSFRWKTHLFRHMKRHEAEKGHACTTCGRGFSVRYDLLRHVRTHTAGNFICDKCGQKFAQLRYLKVHTAKQHSAKIMKVSS